MRLSEEDRAAIKEKWQKGAKFKALAREYGVSTSTIMYHARGDGKPKSKQNPKVKPRKRAAYTTVELAAPPVSEGSLKVLIMSGSTDEVLKTIGGLWK